MFTKRTVIRNKRQLEGESLNLSPLDVEETFLHSANPTLSSPPLLSKSQLTTTTTTTSKHGMRKRHRRHRNAHVEQRTIDDQFGAKLAKFASVWSTIVHSGPNLASKGLNEKANQGLEEALSSTSGISSSADTAIDTDSDNDQAKKPVLLQRNLHELPALRPLSKHQFTFQASQPDSTSSRALIASTSREQSNGELSEQQLIASLLIDSLSSEDNGVYLCRVDFRKARSRTQESILKIIGKYSRRCEGF